MTLTSAEVESIVSRKKEIPPDVSRNSKKIVGLSRFVHGHPELGSEENQAYEKFVTLLKADGIPVEEHFLGIDTSFLARIGNSKPYVAVLAEYDALPIGHACGHNLIGSWAYGVTVSLKDRIRKGTLFLVGTPAEEGRGKYASSKVQIAPKLKEMGVEAAFTVHPADKWEVGGNSLAIGRYSVVFHGKDSHAAASPQQGKNAVDAAVQFYLAYRMRHTLVRRDKDVVMSIVIKDGGSAPNIIPGKSEVWFDLRSNDSEYAKELLRDIEDMAKAAALMNRCEHEFQQINPFLESKKQSAELDKILYEASKRYLDVIESPDVSWSLPARASTDVGNVSHLIPTTHLGIKIGESGMPGHSEIFRERAGSKEAEEALLTAVAVAYEAVLDYIDHH